MLGWYRSNRARSRALFDLLADDAYYSQPIALRHPDRLLRRTSARLQLQHARQAGARPSEHRCQARGALRPRHRSGGSDRGPQGAYGPTAPSVEQFAAEADRQVIDAIAHADVEQPGHPLLDRAEAVFAILEHEAMHQETLLYMWHRLPFDQKHAPPGYRPRVSGSPPSREWIEVPGGCATLGVERGSIPIRLGQRVPVGIRRRRGVRDRAPRRDQRTLSRVRRGGRLSTGAVVDAGGLAVGADRARQSPALLGARGRRVAAGAAMFDRVPLPLSWPVYVSQAEASAYARWRGARLPTEAEFQRAAYGSPAGERRYPWGDAEPTPADGVFDFSSWDPEPAGSHPTDRAPGASKISSATAGSGPARRSRRFPASARWRRTRSTRPISSTASTSS